MDAAKKQAKKQKQKRLEQQHRNKEQPEYLLRSLPPRVRAHVDMEHHPQRSGQQGCPVSRLVQRPTKMRLPNKDQKLASRTGPSILEHRIATGHNKNKTLSIPTQQHAPLVRRYQLVLFLATTRPVRQGHPHELAAIEHWHAERSFREGRVQTDILESVGGREDGRSFRFTGSWRIGQRSTPAK